MASGYQQALETGSKRIIEMAREIARDERVPITRIFWGEGRLLPNYVSQILTIEVAGERVKGVFHEAWISHPEGKLEQKKAESIIREMLGQIGHA